MTRPDSKPVPPKASCSECCYREPEDRGAGHGVCRRLCAPGCGVGGFAVWPRTHAADWCGEFEGRGS